MFVLFLIGLHVVSYLAEGAREHWVAEFGFGIGRKGGHPFYSVIMSAFLYSNTFFMIVNVFFMWAILPTLFKQVNGVLVFFGAMAASIFSCAIYFQIYPVDQLLLLSYGFMPAIFGMCLVKNIWATVDTLVFGPGLFRVYSVPLYVLMFFWFFYFMLANFFQPKGFDEVPMIYLISFMAFFMGIAWERMIYFSTKLLNAVKS